VQENPLAAGALAVAVGAAIGLACPATDYEDRAMGETRDQALAKARPLPTTSRRMWRQGRRVCAECGGREPEECGLEPPMGQA
jgi:hypothetical protein